MKQRIFKYIKEFCRSKQFSAKTKSGITPLGELGESKTKNLWTTRNILENIQDITAANISS
jgi:hypothetical protein